MRAHGSYIEQSAQIDRLVHKDKVDINVLIYNSSDWPSLEKGSFDIYSLSSANVISSTF
jgi:hypothetical protein